MSVPRPSERSLLVLLAACSTIGPSSTHLFLPSLPSIRDYFEASLAAVQTSISLYLIFFACGILVVGPLSDRFGRRPTVIGGAAIFTLGSLIGALAPSLFWLDVGRIVQALGAAAGFTTARAMAGDLFESTLLVRRLAALTTISVISTTSSPVIGGVLTGLVGWRGGFWALFAGGVALTLVCWRRLPETRQSGLLGASAAQILGSARSLLVHPVFIGSVVQTGAVYAVFMSFMAAAPHILATGLGRPVAEFGLYFMLLTGGYFLGNLYVSRQAHGADAIRMTQIGLQLQFGSAALALALALAGLTHPLWLFGPMLPLAFGQGLALPHVMARAVSLAPGFAGVASSLLGFAQQLIASASVQAMGWAPVDSAVPVLIFCTATAALAFVPNLFWRRARSGRPLAGTDS